MMGVLLIITLQLWLHSYSIPIKLWWKCGIMWIDLVERVGRSNSHDANDLCGGTPAVHRTLCVVDVFTLAQDALGVK